MLLFSKIKTQVYEQEEARNLKSTSFCSSKHGSYSKVSQGLEETWNNLYAGYIKGDASTLALQSLLEDEQRAKCGGVVDGC